MRKPLSPKGSILIWSLFLGISLTTVFFFLSQRLNASAASQRETIQYQNARLFLESYADYLEGLDAAILATLRGDIDFEEEGITGTLTNETETITGMLDMEAEVSYEVGDGEARIEWNLCSSGEKGIVEMLPPSAEFDAGCAAGYDVYTQNAGPTFTIKSLSEPFSYKISPVGNAKLYDNEWQLDLEMTLGFRRKITLSRTFTP